jgi:hypothetical protein
LRRARSAVELLDRDIGPRPDDNLSGGLSRTVAMRTIACGCARTLAIVLTFVVTLGAHAHHSFAMFDNENQIKLKGKVTHFQWTNPHVYIELDAENVYSEDKTIENWTVECANPGILNRIGWKFNMLKPGDEITIIVAARRPGEPGALLKQVTLPDGRVFANGGPAGPALIQ